MRRVDLKFIKCRLCGREFLRITNTHLWKEHRITIQEYKEKFPEAPIDTKKLSYNRVSHFRGKTYEEIYGKQKGKKLRGIRMDNATKQMKDPEQIKIRRKKLKGKQISYENRDKLSQSMTKHGSNNYRKRALEYYGLECQRCGKSTKEPLDFVVHHKDFSNIPGALGNHSLENLMVLCKKCHGKLHNEIKQTKGRFVGINSIEKGVHYILKGLGDEFGLDLYDENFKDTPKRIARAYAEIFEGVSNTKEKVTEILSQSFPCEYDEMITVKNIEVFSMCPHHFLPVKYSISAAYIPSKDGKVIGISKLSRLVEILSRRPVLQEQLVEDITRYLMTLKGCKGAASIAYGQHYCMMMRGVKQSHSTTITSSMKGVFLNKQAAREELMQLIRG